MTTLPTLRPSAFVSSTLTNTTAVGNINDQNDATYVESQSGNGVDGQWVYELDDPPSGFAAMDTYTVAVRARISALGDDTWNIRAFLTDAAGNPFGGAVPAYQQVSLTLTSEFTFTPSLPASNDAPSWRAARIVIDYQNVKNMAADGNVIRVAEAFIDGTYSEAGPQTVIPAAVGATAAVVAPTVAGATTVVAPSLSVALAFQPATVTSQATRAPAAVGLSAQVRAPLLVYDQFMAAPSQQVTTAVPVATTTPGAMTVVAGSSGITASVQPATTTVPETRVRVTWAALLTPESATTAQVVTPGASALALVAQPVTVTTTTTRAVAALSLALSPQAPTQDLGAVAVAAATTPVSAQVRQPFVVAGQVTSIPAAVGLTAGLQPAQMNTVTAVATLGASLALQPATVDSAVAVDAVALPVVMAVRAPTLDTEETVSPSVVGLVAQVQAPTAAAGSVAVTALSLSVVATVHEAAVATAVTPAALAMSAAVGVPSTAEIIHPAAVGLTSTIPAPTVVATRRVSPNALSFGINASVSTAVQVGGVVTVTTAVALVAGVPVAATGVGGVTVTPSRVPAVWQVHPVTTTTVVTRAPDALGLVAGVPTTSVVAPIVRAPVPVGMVLVAQQAIPHVAISVGSQSITAQVQPPRLVYPQTVQAASLDVQVRLREPVALVGGNISPDPLDLTAAVQAPTPAVGPVTVQPTGVDLTAQVHDVTVVASVTTAVGAVGATLQVQAVVAGSGDSTVTVASVGLSATVQAAVAVPSGVVVTPSPIALQGAISAPVVVLGEATATPAAVAMVVAVSTNVRVAVVHRQTEVVGLTVMAHSATVAVGPITRSAVVQSLSADVVEPGVTGHRQVQPASVGLDAVVVTPTIGQVALGDVVAMVATPGVATPIAVIVRTAEGVGITLTAHPAEVKGISAVPTLALALQVQQAQAHVFDPRTPEDADFGPGAQPVGARVFALSKPHDYPVRGEEHVTRPDHAYPTRRPGTHHLRRPEP